MNITNFWDMWDFAAHGFEVPLGVHSECKKIARKVMGVRESWQACQRPLSLKSPIESNPIPPAVLCSVCIDLFKLLLVGQDGQILDTLIVCVDRHSGG